MTTATIAKQLRAAPLQPGVYLLKDAQGQVLYVGKAASLRHRLQSYFGSPANLEPKIRKLVSGVADFEFIVTDTEAEALILENTFIKSRRPKYNARLKDDKTYPYLKIGLNEDFPQVYVTRRVSNDGARYFGPYASAGSVRKTMALLKKLFPYRSCTREIRGDDPRPCLEHYINRCVAPCIGAADRAEYRKVIDQVVMFMEGRTEAVVKDLRGKMEAAADAWQFERASQLRDQLRAIERVTQGQKVVSLSGEDQDVIAMARGGDEAWVEVFFVRRGKLIGREHFVMGGVQDDSPERVMADFVKQYYDRAPHVPPRLLLQHAPDDAEPIRAWLEQKRGRRVELRAPQRGEKRKLVEMVAENAGQRMEQFKVKWLADEDALESAMEELQEGLNLPRLPRRMECYDISNIQGTTPVGSMVVFEDGQAKSSHYRRFKIRSVEGIDDYAMMQEMLRRRFRRMGRTATDAEDDSAAAHSDGDGDSAAQAPAWGIVPRPGAHRRRQGPPERGGRSVPGAWH